MPRSQPEQTGRARDSGWLAQERARFLIARLGSAAAVAKALGVPVSEPARWADGTELADAATALRLLGLDHVVASALLLWPAPVAIDWLQSPNAHLAGARPLDVLALRGAGAVTDAIDAELAGAFA